MSLATVLISGREWLLPAAGLLLFAILLLVWSYRNSPLRGPFLAASITLKLVGVLALALCLVDPLWSGKRARPGANIFAVLVDNSQSMQIKDRGQKTSRGDLVRKNLEQHQVVFGKGIAFFTVDRLKDAQQLIRMKDGHGREIPGLKFGASIHLT